MVYITGDTHGSYSHIEKFARRNALTKADTVICLGDTGLNYYGDERDNKMKQRVAKIPITLFCIHGNHDRRPATVAGYEEVRRRGGIVYRQKAYPQLLFAKDGEVYTLGGVQAIAIGGAYSIDKTYRLQNGYNWFSDEQPSPAVKQRVVRQLAGRHHTIHTVLSHTCPARYVPQEALFKGVDQTSVDTSTEQWLGLLEQHLHYSRWFCGHFHINKQVDKMHFLFRDILPF